MAGLVRSKRIFTPKFVAGLKAFGESGYAATISVFTRTVTYEGITPTVVKTVVYSGGARVQPLSTPSQVDAEGDHPFVQTVRFQINNQSTKLDPETMFVEITACANNEHLLGYTFVVKEVLDSSNPIEQTFTGVVDTGE